MARHFPNNGDILSSRPLRAPAEIVRHCGHTRECRTGTLARLLENSATHTRGFTAIGSPKL
jgi:hypothetical protein